jgi:putative glutamine amidotransferase
VALHADEPATLDGFAGLYLTGGADVNPAFYGEEPQPLTEKPDASRDALERALIGQAMERRLPVFGICRGQQMLNVALGGTLAQHIDRHSYKDTPEVHPVEIRPGTRLASILNAPGQMVNSMHHQAIGRLAPGLKVSATAPDGTIEAVELEGAPFVVTVQWHPEERHETYALDRLLFDAFAEALARA